MKKVIGIVRLFFMFVVAMIAGMLCVEVLPLKVMIAVAVGILLFLIGVSAGKRVAVPVTYDEE